MKCLILFSRKNKKISSVCHLLNLYLASLGCPTDIAYGWARPAIIVAGKGRGGDVFTSSFSSLLFLFLFLPCSSLSSLLSLLSLFSLSMGDDIK